MPKKSKNDKKDATPKAEKKEPTNSKADTPSSPASAVGASSAPAAASAPASSSATTASSSSSSSASSSSSSAAPAVTKSKLDRSVSAVLAAAPFTLKKVSPSEEKVVLNPGAIKRNERRILVTGGCGFIGSHLIDRLMADKNNFVICVDNCFSGNKSNIQHWINNERFEFHRHDVCQELHGMEVDQVYHLACPASPVFYQYDPVQTMMTNVVGTKNMLDVAKRCQARFLISSTSETYGDPEIHPQVEEYWGNVNPIGIRSCYDEGKRSAETLCFDYWRRHKVDVRVARIFNTYGPRMLENDGRVVSNFIVQALSGKPITIYGDGSQTRSFCYVSDLVEGLIRLMNQDYIGPVNLGNPGEYTISELAAAIQAAINPRAQLVYHPTPSDDPRRRKPDITKAQKYLSGWEPTVALADGLDLTIRDFRARFEAGALVTATKQSDESKDSNKDAKESKSNKK